MTIAAPAVTRDRGPALWLRGLGLAGAVFLGAVLLLAAWAKMIHPVGFAATIKAEGLDRILPAMPMALLALAVEIALGAALFLGVRHKGVLLPATLLVAFFLFLNGRAWWQEAHGLRSADASCGCFGNLLERTPAEAFWQDALLLVPALLLSFVGRGRHGELPRVRLSLAAAATLAGLFFAWKAPELPLDDWATRLRVGSKLADLCAGRGPQRVCMTYVLSEAQEGTHVVVMADLTAEAFQRQVSMLNDYAIANRGPRLWVISANSQEDMTRFRWSNGPAFEIREAPSSLLAPLYRNLPRAFLVQDGEVTATYRGLPPLAELAR